MTRKLSIAILAAALAIGLLAPAGAEAAFGITAVSGFQRTAGGAPLLVAGAHPDVNLSFALNLGEDPATGETGPDGNLKDVRVTLPEGLVGNPTATSKCSQADLVGNGPPNANCAPQTQVGVAAISLNGQRPPNFTVPVYNVVPPRGVAGEFGFNVVGTLILIDADVTAEGGYRLRAEVHNVSQALAVNATSVTLWGVPGDHSHDLERAPKGGFANLGEPVAGGLPLPFMTNPTACSGVPLRTVFAVDSWASPGAFSEASYDTDPAGRPTVIEGCGTVPFSASLAVAPTTTAAESPTGLSFDLSVPQNTYPDGQSTSSLRGATVALPAGLTVNPSAAGGLGACSPAQIGIGTDAAVGCPAASRIGSVSIETPLLETPLGGYVYLAQQRQNQFGSLLALYLAVDDPLTGVRLKIPGRIDTDPRSGQLVARFADTPQLPFSALHLNLYGGSRAPLMTPPACGAYTTTASLAPWSGTAAVSVFSTFQITSGPDSSACPNGAFTPSLEAGTVDPSAGRHSPFRLRIARGDGSGRLAGVTVRLPKGLLARLSGIPYCADPALASIPAAEGTGAAQLATPSCPPASRLGSVAVATGAGPIPFWVKTGSAYLAGPYRGAPLSLAIVTPALAGPFDLGNVVVRVALRVDPETAQVTAVSDPLPTILAGIPLDLRAVDVSLDRPSFTLNPTSCAGQSFVANLTSTAGATFAASDAFAAKSCGKLGFAPKLSLTLRGGTSRGAHPALTAKLTARQGQANIGRVSVLLPHSEFLAQEHIRTICTRVQFAARTCPKASIYGYAEARTPLLGKPLRGPVYLRSSSHQLPDLVAALRGQIEVDLDGRIDSVRGGIRTTFATVPDAPIRSFVLRLPSGERSLLVNSTDVCRGEHRATVTMLGQNGKRADSSPRLAARCDG